MTAHEITNSIEENELILYKISLLSYIPYEMVNPSI